MELIAIDDCDHWSGKSIDLVDERLAKAAVALAGVRLDAFLQSVAIGAEVVDQACQ
ncbi:hypothetical protein [Paraliomyxa miuraensis]|uniref:hypothetical protein n=1 Tax=Paraliomyxa miuraensis TaxID=376150 RepID=UPI00225BF607|nr:hypothetical protein [Paraliomyxa miuraensis]MCX4243383.1 hypothetical protein [Paraliomyxa miuraensis]